MEISYIRYAGTGEPLCIDGEVALVAAKNPATWVAIGLRTKELARVQSF